MMARFMVALEKRIEGNGKVCVLVSMFMIYEVFYE
jgi:hypothetical protein